MPEINGQTGLSEATPDQMLSDEQRAKLKTENIDHNTEISESELSSEALAILGQKRDILNSSEMLNLRFMNINEYLGLMDRTTFTRGESLKLNSRGLIGIFDSVRNGYGPEIPPAFRIDSPGRAWSIIGSKITDWFGFNGHKDQDTALKYYEQIKAKNSPEVVQIMYVDYLKENMQKTLEIYRQGGNGTAINSGKRVVGSSNPNSMGSQEPLRAETIERIGLLLSKPSGDFTESDQKELMLHSRIKFDAERVNYQILVICRPVNPDDNRTSTRGSMVSGRPTDILAVLPIIDNSIINDILKQKSIDCSKTDPSSAHLVLDINGREEFPENGRDFIEFRKAQQSSESNRGELY